MVLAQEERSMSLEGKLKRYSVSHFFHFTDKRNIQSIRDNGGLYSLKQLSEKGISVPAPGGNQLSQDLARHHKIDDYISLCFRPTHPMEFAAKDKGHIKETVFIPIKAAILDLEGTCFCNGVSNRNGAEIIPIDEAEDKIDFEVLYTKTDWSDTAIQARLQEAEKCEILIPKFIPTRFLQIGK